LTVWIYDECYLRLAALDYDPNTNNKFTHLTNNCVVKDFHSKKNGKKDNEKTQDADEESGEDDDDEEEFDNIMSDAEFSDNVEGRYSQRFGKDVYEKHIKPQIFA